MKFTDLLDEAGVSYMQEGEHHHCRSGWVQLDCPYCSPKEEKFRLGYNLYGRYFNCWSCGPAKTFDTIRALIGETRINLSELERDETSRQREIIVTGKYTPPPGLGSLKRLHREYLSDRGFDPYELVERWQIGGLSALGGNYAWRIFIPVIYDEKPVSWTTRALNDNGMRYLNAPPENETFSIKKVLYGEEYCQHSIVVTEGVTDVWKIGPGAVCTMGLSYTKVQLLRMTRFQKVFVCFDPDADGQRRASKLCDELAPIHCEVRNFILDSGDPGSASEKELNRVRKYLR